MKIFAEFFRYTIVGGIAFLADAGSLAFFREIVFKKNQSEWTMAVCVAIGFTVGLLVNYTLSLVFVFRSDRQQKQGRTVKAFILYAVIGLVGFGLTELGMYIGVRIVGSAGLWYLLVKCFVAGIVLVWNYAGRKILIFREV